MNKTSRRKLHLSQVFIQMNNQKKHVWYPIFSKKMKCKRIQYVIFNIFIVILEKLK